MPLRFRLWPAKKAVRREKSAGNEGLSTAHLAREPGAGVAVIGCGRMGMAMAGELSRRGCFITMYDETDFTRTRAKHNLQAALMELVSSGLLPPHEPSQIMSRVKVADTLEDAVATAAIVFEAVIDDPVLKRDLFVKMVQAGCTAMLTTNTIKLGLKDITAGTDLTIFGCRFLFPVWFIDEVEITLGTTRDTQLAATLSALGYKISAYAGRDRLRLSKWKHARYLQAQRTAVQQQREEDAHAERQREELGQARPAGGIDESDAEVDTAQLRDDQICAVCLDRPSSALLQPCGHTSMCLECAKKLQPAVCVTCRQPIQRILPWKDI